jgi:CRP-like cAMP-binding protein
VLSVDATPVLGAMDHRASVAQAMNQLLLEHTRALHQKIAVMSAGSVPQRLATLFLLLAERFGDEMDDGTTRVPVHLSRRELCRLVGATEETVIRQMTRWQKAGILTTVADGFDIADASALREIVSGAD